MTCHIIVPLGTLTHTQLSIQTLKSSTKDNLLDTRCSETFGAFPKDKLCDKSLQKGLFKRSVQAIRWEIEEK